MGLHVAAFTDLYTIEEITGTYAARCRFFSIELPMVARKGTPIQ